MAQVRLPSVLRPYADGERELEIDATSLRTLLDNLREQFPALERRLRDETGRLRRYVNFYVDGDECRMLEGIDTPLKSDSEVMIIPAVAGG
ncbi:MoaD/ThiS family protein [Nocardia cyriacigeorgica]|uniref:MoaD/ThiS family protein n=1 Tax=Nocardia cyriacigeorgica TaxID=135487 RepID=A0A5R8PAZ6_9NOCA|nr:MoaD/ThiS family protein [Nocardia cyriacigeorgica]TLG05366.1 MoaD/ThiS family protein [Nocardia cyriacigeorgica]